MDITTKQHAQCTTTDLVMVGTPILHSKICIIFLFCLFKEKDIHFSTLLLKQCILKKIVWFKKIFKKEFAKCLNAFGKINILKSKDE